MDMAYLEINHGKSSCILLDCYEQSLGISSDSATKNRYLLMMKRRASLTKKKTTAHVKKRRKQLKKEAKKINAERTIQIHKTRELEYGEPTNEEYVSKLSFIF